jgi:hypothetical protein
MQANLELSEDQKKAKRKTELMGGWPVSSTFETAKEVLRKAKEGADFAKLAKDYSDDPGSKDKGGECTFPRGQMVPRFEAAAFALKTNEISDIIETPFGYHIIKCYERIPAKKVELAKVSTDLKNYLTLKKIRSEGQVEILDNNPKMTELPAPAPSSRGLEALAAGRRHISQPAPAPGSSVPESPLPEAPLPRASQIAERPCEVVCEVCGTIIYGVPYEDACNLRDSHQKYATDQAVREDGATAQKHISTALEIRYRSGGP